MAIQLGAVTYLNARPLVYGLEEERDRFAVRFDVPAECAALLHEGRIDLGLVPSIEYLRRPDYRAVPGVAVVSDGPVASVALYTRCELDQIRSVALDGSSRTSVALLHVLCARRFGMAPRFEVMAPRLEEMLERHDAALIIGDLALFIDAAAEGLRKIDLGQEWRSLTGLPFVYAFWAGWPDRVQPADVERLQAAKAAGVSSVEDVVARYFQAQGGDPERQAVGVRYLRENIGFDLDERAVEGAVRFFDEAAALGLVERSRALEFY